ncbi:MAG: hypothetical protein H6719_00760 [Sandaracinaceae bacterium]|nr:hypothetical protein [Sandaracinaceae bacterium]
MAAKWDNTPPQNLLILACAAGSALLLFTLKFGFDAYYDGMMAETVAGQQARYDDLDTVNTRQAEWNDSLQRGHRMSIDAAMSQLASRGRGADPAIRPERPTERNIAPLEGWNQHPHEVVIPPPAPAANAAPRGLSPEALEQLQQALQNILQQDNGQ